MVLKIVAIDGVAHKGDQLDLGTVFRAPPRLEMREVARTSLPDEDHLAAQRGVRQVPVSPLPIVKVEVVGLFSAGDLDVRLLPEIVEVRRCRLSRSDGEEVGRLAQMHRPQPLPHGSRFALLPALDSGPVIAHPSFCRGRSGDLLPDPTGMR
jgi:hypothetical protein